MSFTAQNGSGRKIDGKRKTKSAAVNPLYYALIAMLTAVTTVFTLLIRVPIPATQGYINFSDVATYFSGFSFGAVTGGIAGGIGAAIADLLGGYAQFAPLTLLAHGAQGLLAGLIGRKGTLPMLILGWAAGTIAMVGLYFLGEGLVYTTFANALVEVPFNLLQNIAGGVIGIPLYYAVRKAYPAITQFSVNKRSGQR
ncbi:MAG: ECF transporter S component [Chloroflexi bacterium]|nr:ECF transporter S component [Chloroflexota bacterium]